MAGRGDKPPLLALESTCNAVRSGKNGEPRKGNDSPKEREEKEEDEKRENCSF